MGKAKPIERSLSRRERQIMDIIKLSDAELARLARLIDRARKEGR